jgi:phosphonopyruvate decarboxylase
MIDLPAFGGLLQEHGFTFFSGVPCSFLRGLINYALNHLDYCAAANEGDAVAIAAGAALGGRRAAVMLQNSGLTNALSPLTSLNHVFRIPVLGFVSLRGEPGVADEPQHELLGEITAELLRVCRIETLLLDRDFGEARRQVSQANRLLRQDRSVFVIVRKGTFAEEPLVRKLRVPDPARRLRFGEGRPTFPRRIEALAALNGLRDRDTVLLTTTGKTGRELYEIADHPGNLYMVGSMGCVSSLGLGLALARPDKKVIAIDGDGALLMRMGALATNGFHRPPNLLHVILDNHCHDSTGGQDTVSENVRFAAVASHSGYPAAIEAHDLGEFTAAVQTWLQAGGLTLLSLPIARGSREALGRPGIKPVEVKERLMHYLQP